MNRSIIIDKIEKIETFNDEEKSAEKKKKNYEVLLFFYLRNTTIKYKFHQISINRYYPTKKLMKIYSTKPKQ